MFQLHGLGLAEMLVAFRHIQTIKPGFLCRASMVKEIQLDGFDRAKKYTVQEIKDRNYNIDLCGYPHEEEEILPPKELIQQYQEKRASLNADIDRILAQITEILGIDLDAQD